MKSQRSHLTHLVDIWVNRLARQWFADLKQEYDSNLELGERCSFALLSVKEGGLLANYRVAHGSVLAGGESFDRKEAEKKGSQDALNQLLIESP